jgi:pre-mRNA-splicing factor CWC26
MPNKLDYLSKYLPSNTSDNAKISKKKKRHKKKKREESVRQYDDEDNFSMMRRGENEAMDDYESEEDRPTVVPSEELTRQINQESIASFQHTTRGTWNTASSNNTTTNTTIQDTPNESSQPSRLRRYDSSEDDEEEPRRRRYDSSEEEENRGGTPPISTRTRHDSDLDDSNENRRRRRDDSDDDLPIKRRYDSSDDQSATQKAIKRDNADNVPQSRNIQRRHDSVSSQEDSKPPPRRQRYDSEEEEYHDSPKAIKQEAKEDNENHHHRRRRHDSSSESENEKERMSSGHKAGLQNYKDFNKSELDIQNRKKKDAKLMVDKYGMGETVYRDKDGKRTVNSPGATVRTTTEEEKQLSVLNQGKVQREVQERQTREMQIMQESNFARHADDDRLEDLRKHEIRKGDPMAAYARKKTKTKKSGKSQEPERPIYKGPPPKPNRFGIQPGYRWDGVDRGNNWEDKLLAKQYMVNQKEEEAYRWRSADM